jgi:hypothetical protein
MSDVLDRTAGTEVGVALGAVGDGLDQLAGAELWGLCGGELTGAVLELHRLACRVQAQMLRLVAEVDVRGAAVELGAPSTASWLSWGLRLHPGAAKRAVRDARALHTDPAGPLVPVAVDEVDADSTPLGRLAVTRAAFASGSVSGEQVSEIVTALDDLPVEVDRETRGRGEVFLVDQARTQGPHQLARLAKRLLHTLDPARGDRLELLERAHAAGNALVITKRSRGGFRLRGELDEELGATLLTALDPLAAPRPATDGTPDQRPVPARYADALADLLKIALASGGLPSSGGARPTVVVTVELATLRRELASAAGELRWAGPISAEAARRLACDAGMVPAVLGGAGEPLDVGRLSYPVTAAIRRALEARDGGCAFPGCLRPPAWCAAHHIEHWAQGGSTAMSNLVLLCDRHHVVVHHQGWIVRIAENAMPEFTPPPWIDPAQVPITTPWRTHLANVPARPAPTQPPARPPLPHPRT